MRNFLQVVLLILILTFPVSVFGQDSPAIDSLKREFKKQQTDTAKIRLLLAISYQYTQSDIKNALSYIKQARKISEHVDCKKCNADILLQEGILFRNSSDFTKALEKFENALTVYRPLNMKSKITLCCIYIRATYVEWSNYDKALSYYSEAINLYKLLKDNEGMARCYDFIARVYYYQKKVKIAIDYVKKAIQLIDKNDKQKRALYYSSLFNCYADQKEYQKALSLVDSIFPIYIETNNFYSLGLAYANLGSVYMGMENYKKAQESNLKAIYYASIIGDTTSLICAKSNLAEIYSAKKQLDSAIFVQKEALELNKQLKNIVLLKTIYSNLYKTYEEKGDINSAFEYYKKYITINDSVVQDFNNNKLLEIQTQYEVDLKNKQIKLLDKDKQLAKQKAIIYGVSLIVVLISSLCFFIYKNRKIREKQLRIEAKHEVELKEAAYKIDLKNRELTNKAMLLSYQEQILSNIKEQLINVDVENMSGKKAILTVLSDIDVQLTQNSMEDFEKYFIEVHPEFFNRLKQKYPELSPAELKMCAFLRLNLNSKEIANLTNKSIRSIETSRYTIRKKMGLSKENLYDFISTI